MPTEACFVHSEALAYGLQWDGMDAWLSSKVNGLLRAPSALIRAIIQSLEESVYTYVKPNNHQKSKKIEFAENNN